MAYYMRYRVQVRLVPAPTGGTPGVFSGSSGVIGDPDDPIAFDVGDMHTLPGTDVVPDGPVIESLPKAISAGLSVVGRLARGLHVYARLDVYGAPVGTVEDGATDIPAGLLAEVLYAQAATPTPALVLAIAAANKKPATTHTRHTWKYGGVGGPEVVVADPESLAAGDDATGG